MTPITIITIPSDHNTPNHVARKNAAKLTTSNKAVGFANHAIAKRNHEIANKYICRFLFSCTERRNTKPLYNASIINDNTHRSVLLSINTKKAPIQELSHCKIRNHPKHKVTPYQGLSSSVECAINQTTSITNQIPKTSTKNELQKFIIIA